MFGMFALCGLLVWSKFLLWCFICQIVFVIIIPLLLFLAYAFGVLFYDRAKVRKIYLLNRCCLWKLL